MYQLRDKIIEEQEKILHERHEADTKYGIFDRKWKRLHDMHIRNLNDHLKDKQKRVMFLHNKITNLVETVIPERIAEERRICKEQQEMARSEWDGIPPHSPYEDAIAAD